MTAYMFRRLVATELFSRKISLQNIQHHMGHMRASTTLRYVQAGHEMNRDGIAAMANLMSSGMRAAFEHEQP